MATCCICTASIKAGPARACSTCHRTWHRDCSLPKIRPLDCSCTQFLELWNGCPAHCGAKGCKRETAHAWFCTPCSEKLPGRLEQFVFAQKRIWYNSPHQLGDCFLQSTSSLLDITGKDPGNALIQAAQKLIVHILATHTCWIEQRAHVFMIALETLKKKGQFTLPLKTTETGVPASLLGAFKQWLRGNNATVFVGNTIIATGGRIIHKDSLQRALHPVTGLPLQSIYAAYPAAPNDLKDLEINLACWVDGARTHAFAPQPQKLLGLKEVLEAVPAHKKLSTP